VEEIFLDKVFILGGYESYLMKLFVKSSDE